MQYRIDYEEIVKRINSVTIEVADEAEGERIADTLADSAGKFNHPDDIMHALHEMKVPIVETCEGAEDASYAIQ